MPLPAPSLPPVQITQLVRVPPGGWTYTQAETGYKMTNISLAGLRDMVRAHRRANGLDLGPGWWEQVQFEMCMEEPFGSTHCKPDTSYKPPKEHVFKVDHVLKFFRAVREWFFKHGFHTVPQEEAERRAAICAECPLNTASVKGCPGCAGVFRWLKDILGIKKTEKENEIFFCGVCLCSLKLKVWLPAGAIEASTDPNEKYPVACWIPKLNPASTDEPRPT